MSELIQEEVISSSSKDTTKDSSKRQGAPVYSLQEILSFCGRIYTELGFGAYHAKELIAEANGLVYDSIKQKLSTAQLLNQLELKYGVGYRLTPLFLKIYKPESQEEKKQGIMESLSHSTLYKRLIDEFKGHPLPSEQGLTARLIRNFDIKDYAAAKIAAIFLNNLRDNGFVGADNVFRVPNGSERNEQVVEKQEVHSNVIAGQQPRQETTPGYLEIPIPLSGGKRAYLKIPEDYTEPDCERIAKFVEALK